MFRFWPRRGPTAPTVAADGSVLPGSLPSDALTRGQRVMERCNLLARHSEEADRLTRPYGTPSLRAAQNDVAAWMRSAGMETRRDAIGNLIGSYPGRHSGPPLLLGSHLDTVRDAGRFDGMLGVLVAIAVVEHLHQRNERLPFPVEVVAFADEEGLRFHTAYLGSRFLIGALDSTVLALRDEAGVTLQEAVEVFGGNASALLFPDSVSYSFAGYVECHLEQGPVLEHLQLPVGVVSAIAGQSRIAVAFSGQAGHAGTVPMDLRRDPLGAAAEFVLAVEEAARECEGAVATVGQIAAEPGASNVIPGRVPLTLDVRHQDDVQRHELCRHLETEARAIAGRRAIDLGWRIVEDQPAVACDPALTALLADAVAATGCPVHQLPSGAGHDAVTLSAIAPVAMLFVRCVRGISHHPDESVSLEDTAVAIDALDRFMAGLAQKQMAGPDLQAGGCAEDARAGPE